MNVFQIDLLQKLQKVRKHKWNLGYLKLVRMHKILLSKNGPFSVSFWFFVFSKVISTVKSKYVRCKILPMTGFELRISGIGSNRSANWVTTTAQICTKCCHYIMTLPKFCIWCMLWVGPTHFACVEYIDRGWTKRKSCIIGFPSSPYPKVPGAVKCRLSRCQQVRTSYNNLSVMREAETCGEQILCRGCYWCLCWRHLRRKKIAKLLLDGKIVVVAGNEKYWTSSTRFVKCNEI